MIAAAAPVLEFDEQAHAYYADGRRVPSVTEILESVGIIDYSKLPDGTRIMALERGRFVHQVCEFDDQGDLGTFDPKLQGYLDAWRAFRTTHGFTPELIEHRGYSAVYRYAGTMDRRGAFVHRYGSPVTDGEALVDIKTSTAPYWTAFQTAAYANFFEHPAKYRRMAVALHADGTFKVSEYRCADFSKHLNVFLAALTVFNAKECR